MRLRVLVVASLVIATAGCSAFVGPSEETETVTAAPVPTVDPTDPQVDVAPGVSANAVTDVDLLAARHAASADARSYVWHETRREYRRDENGTVVGTVTRTVVATNGTHYVRRTTVDRTPPDPDGDRSFHLAEYVTPDDRYVVQRQSRYSDREYYHVPTTADGQFDEVAAESIGRYLAPGPANVSRIGRGDAARYRVTGPLAGLPVDGRVENDTVVAVVGRDGFVSRFNASFDERDGSSRRSVEYGFAYASVGTASVEPPSWLSAARAERP